MSKRASIVVGTRFVKDGNAFMPTSDQNLEVFDTLPVGTFTVASTPTGVLFFKQIENFTLPPKMYGSALRYADRIMNTFEDRTGATGVLLSGEKGSGKTLLTKFISIESMKKGMPTVVINSPFCGDAFNGLIQSLTQPCVILFDEFEKVYESNEQECILTLLDGVFPTKKLFLFTCNNKYRIDAHMTNRPGRIFYHLEYEGLDSEFIVEYCKDNLKDISHISAVSLVASTFDQFNFDMLKALVEEMNRYGEDPYDALLMLNASPTRDKNGQYTLRLLIDDLEIKDPSVSWPGNHTWSGNPVTAKELSIVYYKSAAVKVPPPPLKKLGDIFEEVASGKKAKAKKVSAPAEGKLSCEKFIQSDMCNVNAETCEFTFVNSKGAKLILTKVVEAGFNYNHLRTLDMMAA